MRQYLELKQQHPNAILFFRMGDFYELFLKDAVEGSSIMDIALTNRRNDIPMAGIPHHSMATYIGRLLAAGKRVAIAEQEPDPKNPRLMCRKVRRVITPGTVVEEQFLEGNIHNFLMALHYENGHIGLTLADISTNDFFSYELECANEKELLQIFKDYCCRFRPREALARADTIQIIKEGNENNEEILLQPLEDWKSSPAEGWRQIQNRYRVSPHGLGYQEKSPALGAVALILHYLADTLPNDGLWLPIPVFHPSKEREMLLDEQTVRNLDLVFNPRQKESSHTLYKVIDSCNSPGGKRLLYDNLLKPQIKLETIEKYLSMTRFFHENSDLRQLVRECLQRVADLERVMSRMAAGRGEPRHFSSLRQTIRVAIELEQLLKDQKLPPMDSAEEKRPQLTPSLQELYQRIEEEVVPEPPINLSASAPFILPSVEAELDRAWQAARKGGQWVIDFEKEERKQTGIPNLRVKYNKIYGYFIEISRGQANKAPPGYYIRQTLVNCKRFTNDKLQELESTILKAEETISTIEQRRFNDLCSAVLALHRELKLLMRQLSYLDFFSGLAETAAHRGWSCPQFQEGDTMLIEEGRHPVVEHYLPSGEQFIANSLRMEHLNRRIGVITGPNMAGKSTFIRQTALIQLLAQIGSFVPAKRALLNPVDRIFTRIGASDNLTRGQSTFFVEMLETARILNQCSSRSLVIMDEVGRGTSTYDGLSLAWAIVEYLSCATEARPLTLFATHYHELTSLSMTNPGVFNLTMEVLESGDQVVFSHCVQEGAADRSYGIYVARLAGLPEAVILRAEEKLKELEKRGPVIPVGVTVKKINVRKRREQQGKSQLQMESEKGQRLLFSNDPTG